MNISGSHSFKLGKRTLQNGENSGRDMDLTQRYTTRAVYTNFDRDGNVRMTADEVLVEDDCPTFTGLYDCAGQRIYRQSVKQPIGFKPYREGN